MINISFYVGFGCSAGMLVREDEHGLNRSNSPKCFRLLGDHCETLEAVMPGLQSNSRTLCVWKYNLLELHSLDFMHTFVEKIKTNLQF